MTISTPFKLKIPASFSRLGHVGQTYQMTQGIHLMLPLMAYEVEKVPQWLSEKTGSPAALLRDIDPEEIKQALLNVGQAQAQAGQEITTGA